MDNASDGTKNKTKATHGIWKNNVINVKKQGNKIEFKGITQNDIKQEIEEYFDLNTNYTELKNKLASIDNHLKRSIEYGKGIRILNQDLWETIISFIISANNNIPRIKGIIERLCETFGEDTGDGYSFPTADRLADLTVEDLAPLRAGFRAKYIIDAARKISSGEVDIEKIKNLPFDEAKAELLKIKGVGEKVAQCALLYGFGRIEAFPVDVWVKRIVAELYPNGLPECIKGTEGIAQQYLFHWRRFRE